MTTTRTHKGLFSLALLFLLACQSVVVDPVVVDHPPPFLVTVEQQGELRKIYSDVRKDARKLRHKNEQAVEDLLLAHDDHIRAMLNAAQWTNYDTLQRGLWTQQIYQGGRPKGSRAGISGPARNVSQRPISYQLPISMPPSIN